MHADRLQSANAQTKNNSRVTRFYGAKTKLSRSRVEAPKLLLEALSAWRRETMYAYNDDFVFPSEKLGGKQPRSRSWSRITFARQRFGLA